VHMKLLVTEICFKTFLDAFSYVSNVISNRSVGLLAHIDCLTIHYKIKKPTG